jgi:hypothetical protein
MGHRRRREPSDVRGSPIAPPGPCAAPGVARSVARARGFRDRSRPRGEPAVPSWPGRAGGLPRRARLLRSERDQHGEERRQRGDDHHRDVAAKRRRRIAVTRRVAGVRADRAGRDFLVHAESECADISARSWIIPRENARRPVRGSRGGQPSGRGRPLSLSFSTGSAPKAGRVLSGGNARPGLQAPRG